MKNKPSLFIKRHVTFSKTTRHFSSTNEGGGNPTCICKWMRQTELVKGNN